LALGAQAGGATAKTVDGVAATVADRLALERELSALSAQARLSAVVIAVAPLAFALVATATDPRTAAFLFRSPPGIVCLLTGLTLDTVAAVWMARITAGAE
jgi:tight adherence protein B